MPPPHPPFAHTAVPPIAATSTSNASRRQEFRNTAIRNEIPASTSVGAVNHRQNRHAATIGNSAVTIARATSVTRSTSAWSTSGILENRVGCRDRVARVEQILQCPSGPSLLEGTNPAGEEHDDPKWVGSERESLVVLGQARTPGLASSAAPGCSARRDSKRSQALGDRPALSHSSSRALHHLHQPVLPHRMLERRARAQNRLLNLIGDVWCRASRSSSCIEESPLSHRV